MRNMHLSFQLVLGFDDSLLIKCSNVGRFFSRRQAFLLNVIITELFGPIIIRIRTKLSSRDIILHEDDPQIALLRLHTLTCNSLGIVQGRGHEPRPGELVRAGTYRDGWIK